MSALMGSVVFQMVALLIVVVAIVVVIDRLQDVVPRGSRLEGWAQRWSSAVQALAVVGGLLVAVAVVYGSDVTTWRWLTVGLFVAVGWSARRALSDWANGITLRSEGTLRAGGRIGLGTERGRIRRLGLRSAEVEAEDGRVLRLPYTRLAEADLEVGVDEDAGRSHTFTVDVDGDVEVAEMSDRMTAGALLSPWSSSAPAPHVRVVDRGAAGARFEVTVYPVDPAFVANVEEAVRAAVRDA